MNAKLKYALRVALIGFGSVWTAALFGGVIVFMIWPVVGRLFAALMETRRGNIALMVILWVVIFVRWLRYDREKSN